MISNSTLYLIWLALPACLLLSYIKHKVLELRKPKKVINRSNYYKQIFIFILVCIFLAYLLNEYLLPIIVIDLKLLTAAKYALLPIVIAVLAPYSGSNKAAETKHDKMKKRGYRDPNKRS